MNPKENTKKAIKCDENIYRLRSPSESAVTPLSCVYPCPSSSKRIWFVAQLFCLWSILPTFISAMMTLRKNKLITQCEMFKREGWENLKPPTGAKTLFKDHMMLHTYPKLFTSPFLWASVIVSCCLSFFSSSDSAWLLFRSVAAAAEAAATSLGSSFSLKAHWCID